MPNSYTESLIENVFERIVPYILNIQNKVEIIQMPCQTVKSIVSCCIGKQLLMPNVPAKGYNSIKYDKKELDMGHITSHLVVVRSITRII